MTDPTKDGDDLATDESGPETPQEGDVREDTAQDDSSVARARKDAAKYRERLRDAETERDALTASVEAMRRQLIDGQATSAGIRPAAFWASGQQLDDLLADDGTVDPNLVREAIKTTCEVLGITPRRFTGTADQGPKQSPSGSGVSDWAALLRETPSGR